ncbi:MAG: hypothetical protein FWF82_01900 [Oscillospiraceae bacterium]|nr:hypothetical protein [Oscillospiraceae bacterium]
MKNMKKLIALLLVSMILLSACDIYAGKRPLDVNNVKWVSQNPDIWFIVQDFHCFGEMNLDGEIINIEVPFDYGKGVTVFPDLCEFGDEWLFIGEWEYKMGDSTFVFNVKNNEKGVLDDSVKTITFTKENYDTGIRWFDDVESKWISADPDIWFTVGSDPRSGHKDSGTDPHTGEMRINDEIIEFEIDRHNGGYTWVITDKEKPLFRFFCRHSTDEFTAFVIIDEDSPQYFDEEDKIITFVRG